MEEQLISEKRFPYKHFTTTKSCLNMKDEAARSTLLRFFSLDDKNLVLAKQVHGNNVQVVVQKDKGTFIDGCDGLITKDKNVILGIFTADCMPVLLISTDKSVKGAVHAGWRGLASGILQNAIRIFKKEFGVSAENITAYIGPHIRKCCYEVNAELEKVFNIKLKNGKLNLSEIAEKLLEKEGVSVIYVSEHCSCCESDLFFSYRKNKTESRMITLIA